MTRSIPAHLQAWIVQQRPELYTPIDQAAWRYIMRVSSPFFAASAHKAYLDGLQATGISTEHIPLIAEMDQRMQRIGWRAVAVSGFISPQAFMEFQALGILPIACDMRKLEHILYTPAPDVVHEAAGHAPLIADPDYSNYLRSFGEISRQAIYSSQDMALYRAIRRLSEIKEDPAALPEQVAQAQRHFEETAVALDWISESNELSRLYWWTVEYGLVGDLTNPRIFGAGLLSSAGESWHCLGPGVRRLPLTVDCVRQAYDITSQQPQLFVTPDFPHMRAVLEEYATSMACRVGGVAAVDKALRAQAPTTATLDSGLQISGVLKERLLDPQGELAYLQYAGPVLLADGNQPIAEHGRDAHQHGFGTAIGRLATAAVEATGAEGAAGLDNGAMRTLGFGGGGRGRLEFASGVVLEGRISHVREGMAGNQIIRFEDCRVHVGDRLLFDPAWGSYDLGCGIGVTAISGGWVDSLVDPVDLPSGSATMKCNLLGQNEELIPLYEELRQIRESGGKDRLNQQRLLEIVDMLDRDHPQDWLLRLELVELGSLLPAGRVTALRDQLNAMACRCAELDELVGRGLALCS